MATTPLPPSAVASSSSNAVVASGATVHLVTGDRVASASSAADPQGELAGAIRKVAISADGAHAVTAGDDKSLRVWALHGPDAPALVSTRHTTKRVADMAFDSSNNIIVTDKVGDVFSYPFEPRAVENRPQGFVVASDPSLNPDADLLLGHVSLICQTVLTQDGKHIITADRDEHIRVGRYPLAYVIDRYLWGSEGFVSSIHIPSSRPNLLVSGGGEPTLQVFDWTTGALLQRVDMLAAVSPWRAVRPPARKIKGKRKVAGGGSSVAPSDDPASAGWYAAPEGHMYPIGQGVCVAQLGSVVVGDATVVLFHSLGASALHAFTLAADGTAGDVRTLPLPHPVLGFAPVGPHGNGHGSVLVTLDAARGAANAAAPAPAAAPGDGAVALVSVAADGALSLAADADAPLLGALRGSLAAPALCVPAADAARLNLYADLQILPRWPGFEEDEALAGGPAAAGADALPANVDELAPKRLGRLKAQGHDVHIPAKKRKKSKSEKKRERAAAAAAAAGAAAGDAHDSAAETSTSASAPAAGADDDEEAAMNQ